eukprot:SAG31_NODE_15970_length_729_cov_0.817460_2_plen_51_part_01
MVDAKYKSLQQRVLESGGAKLILPGKSAISDSKKEELHLRETRRLEQEIEE